MKVIDLLKPKQSLFDLLNEGKVIYLKNEMEGVVVKMGKDKTYLKFPEKKNMRWIMKRVK